MRVIRVNDKMLATLGLTNAMTFNAVDADDLIKKIELLVMRDNENNYLFDEDKIGGQIIALIKEMAGEGK